MQDSESSAAARRFLFLYDGDCAFCVATTRWMRTRLAWFPPALPHDGADLVDFGLTDTDVADSAWLLTPRGRFGGHLAYAALLRMQPALGLRFLGHLLSAPPFSWVARIAYAGLARIRHRLPGGWA
jgi:predicted DCC family thiol-disulfide oxidoreductase YuxK